jgi:Fe-S oxidoreductase
MKSWVVGYATEEEIGRMEDAGYEVIPVTEELEEALRDEEQIDVFAALTKRLVRVHVECDMSDLLVL